MPFPREGVPVPESVNRLVAEIDRLIDEELAHGPYDDDIGQADCALCGGDWHGTQALADTAREHGRIPDCPGAYATDAQREEWLALAPTRRSAPAATACDRALRVTARTVLEIEGLEDHGFCASSTLDLEDHDFYESCGSDSCDCDGVSDLPSPDRAARDSMRRSRAICVIPLDF